MKVAAVVIGRNEGDRLAKCLDSLTGQADPIIYVDSGSTDQSIKVAEKVGATVVSLDMSKPFTAARARNAGLDRIKDIDDGAEYVQLVDGDCEVREGWIEVAVRFLEENEDAAMVAGRLRERSPEESLWNRLADAEWAVDPGQVQAVGGIAMARRRAIEEVGRFREELVAGEEPELCLRLRRRGWKIHRLADEMAFHDIAMHRISQWWTRCRRCGFAYAEGAALHGFEPERYRVRETVRALFWGSAIPFIAIFGAFFTPWTLVLLLAWPMQMVRLKVRGFSTIRSIFLTLGMIPESLGVMDYVWKRAIGRKSELFEYK